MLVTKQKVLLESKQKAEVSCEEHILSQIPSCE